MRTPGADGYQSAYHLACALEDTSRVVIAQHLERFVERPPLARGDAFGQLGRCVSGGTLEQEEVTIFVNVPSAKSEMPVDDADGALEAQVIEACFFGCLPPRRVRWRLSVFQMTLGESPVVVGIANEQ